MPRILVAECKQEVSTFNPCLSGYDDFTVCSGDAMIAHYRGSRAEISGALSVFDAEPAFTVVPATSAALKRCGGTLADAAWRRIAHEFLTAIEQAPPVDAVYFSFHGAMAAEDELDPEGYLLAETRRLLGEHIPIVVSMDLHGIPTRRMFEHSDAIVAFHTYAHVDLFETGQRAARLLRRILLEGARPVTACVAVPALVRGDELITATGAIRRPIDRAVAFEAKPGGLSAGLFIGNPFTDVPELQSYAFAVSDGDAERAAREALALAQDLWVDHERMVVPLVGFEEMIRRIRTVETGTAALIDAADPTSSGASGDSVAILRHLRAAGYAGRTLAPVVDPPAVQAAMAAGVGGRVRTTVGGALDRRRFTPMEIDASVRLLSNGRFRNESFGDEWHAGPTAVLEADRLTIVATTRPVHLFDRSLFLAHGQDPRNFDAVVVKSPHCQPHMYADWCAALIHVNGPGATSADLRSLGHTRCPRPIFPLDAVVPFHPEARMYQRARYKTKS